MQAARIPLLVSAKSNADFRRRRYMLTFVEKSSKLGKAGLALSVAERSRVFPAMFDHDR